MSFASAPLPCAGYVRHVTHDEIADAIGENLREILRSTGGTAIGDGGEFDKPL